MIGRLRGALIEKTLPTLLVEVAGVGYEIEAPLTTFYRLPETGAEVLLYIHLVVRDDAQLLFGFIEERERNLFRALIRVNGVGPRLALTILSGIEADQFVRCVKEKNTQALIRLPGVGRKTAERLIMEMADRLEAWDTVSTVVSTQRNPDAAAPQRQRVKDAEAALIALGYKPQDAALAIARVDDDVLEVEGLIRKALQNMR